jgi:hypothetical protein
MPPGKDVVPSIYCVEQTAVMVRLQAGFRAVYCASIMTVTRYIDSLFIFLYPSKEVPE